MSSKAEGGVSSQGLVSPRHDPVKKSISKCPKIVKKNLGKWQRSFHFSDKENGTLKGSSSQCLKTIKNVSFMRLFDGFKTLWPSTMKLILHYCCCCNITYATFWRFFPGVTLKDINHHCQKS